MKEETEEKEESQDEMGLGCRDHQDHPDLQDRSSTKAVWMLLAVLDLREDQECPGRLDSLAQLDLKASVESQVCPDTDLRGRKVNQGWWLDLMEASSDWRD